MILSVMNRAFANMVCGITSKEYDSGDDCSPQSYLFSAVVVASAAVYTFDTLLKLYELVNSKEDDATEMWTPDRAEAAERREDHSEQEILTEREGAGEDAEGDSVEAIKDTVTFIDKERYNVMVQVVTKKPGWKPGWKPTNSAILLTRVTRKIGHSTNVENKELVLNSSGHWEVVGGGHNCSIAIEENNDVYLGRRNRGGGGVPKCGTGHGHGHNTLLDKLHKSEDDERWSRVTPTIRIANITHCIIGSGGETITRPVNVTGSLILSDPVGSINRRGVLVADRSRGERNLLTFDMRVDVTTYCRCLQGRNKPKSWESSSFSLEL
jgi:hypothetical protein